jgi:predicted nucleotidyltransferase
MDRAEISRLLAGHAEDLKAYGVLALSVFGSVARGQARPDSDIDLLVEFERPIGLFRFVGLQQLLEGILGRRVDLVPRDSIRRALRDVILGEAVRVA